MVPLTPLELNLNLGIVNQTTAISFDGCLSAIVGTMLEFKRSSRVWSAPDTGRVCEGTSYELLCRVWRVGSGQSVLVRYGARESEAVFSPSALAFLGLDP